MGKLVSEAKIITPPGFAIDKEFVDSASAGMNVGINVKHLVVKRYRRVHNVY